MHPSASYVAIKNHNCRIRVDMAVQIWVDTLRNDRSAIGFISTHILLLRWTQRPKGTLGSSLKQCYSYEITIFIQAVRT